MVMVSLLVVLSSIRVRQHQAVPAGFNAAVVAQLSSGPGSPTGSRSPDYLPVQPQASLLSIGTTATTSSELEATWTTSATGLMSVGGETTSHGESWYGAELPEGVRIIGTGGDGSVVPLDGGAPGLSAKSTSCMAALRQWLIAEPYPDVVSKSRQIDLRHRAWMLLMLSLVCCIFQVSHITYDAIANLRRLPASHHMVNLLFFGLLLIPIWLARTDRLVAGSIWFVFVITALFAHRVFTERPHLDYLIIPLFVAHIIFSPRLAHLAYPLLVVTTAVTGYMAYSHVDLHWLDVGSTVLLSGIVACCLAGASTLLQRKLEVMRTAEMRYMTLLNGGYEGVVLLGGYTILDGNRSMQEMFHMRMSALKGTSVLDLIVETDRIKLAKLIESCPLQHALLRTDTQPDGPAGMFAIEVSVIFHPATSHTVCAFRTIEHFARLEAVLVAAKENDMQAQYQQAQSSIASAEHKSRMYSSLAHQATVPLQTVVSAVKLLDEHSLGEGARQCARLATDAADHLSSIMSSFQSIDNVYSDDMDLDSRIFDLTTVLSQVLSQVRSVVAAKAVDLDGYISPDVPLFARGDPARLELTLTTVIEATVRLSETSGSVMVSAKVSSEDEARQLGATALVPLENEASFPPGTFDSASYYRIDVTDSSPGMALKDMSMLFQPFQHGASNIAIETIGLYVARQLLRKMGGQIVPHSVEGHGSTFVMIVPLFPVSGSLVPVSATVRPPKWMNLAVPTGIVVLFANDDLRRTMGSIMADFGLSVYYHAVPWRAVDVFANDEVPFLVVERSMLEEIVAALDEVGPLMPSVVYVVSPPVEELTDPPDVRHPGVSFVFVPRPLDLAEMRAALVKSYASIFTHRRTARYLSLTTSTLMALPGDVVGTPSELGATSSQPIQIRKRVPACVIGLVGLPGHVVENLKDRLYAFRVGAVHVYPSFAELRSARKAVALHHIVFYDSSLDLPIGYQVAWFPVAIGRKPVLSGVFTFASTPSEAECSRLLSRFTVMHASKLADRVLIVASSPNMPYLGSLRAAGYDCTIAWSGGFGAIVAELNVRGVSVVSLAETIRSWEAQVGYGITPIIALSPPCHTSGAARFKLAGVTDMLKLRKAHSTLVPCLQGRIQRSETHLLHKSAEKRYKSLKDQFTSYLLRQDSISRMPSPASKFSSSFRSFDLIPATPSAGSLHSRNSSAGSGGLSLPRPPSISLLEDDPPLARTGSSSSATSSSSSSSLAASSSRLCASSSVASRDNDGESGGWEEVPIVAIPLPTTNAPRRLSQMMLSSSDPPSPHDAAALLASSSSGASSTLSHEEITV
ncbi:uncharacterized protein AMSG_09096 [Thecamonas trahens ATCC 50062]|uniref:histidine kinase n=1 Tax=Thecamonas trahens ATCC 50062 TaxID=461836 RepID=A0A0L0DND8_THETB|nr:hypothetical protein AMSG_09096 [Thecamonas trahens ATCC 50062]KNC52928.1 hypothetical protein AMSG_09096 [Thecamonas trahens ATCC 50062]|eukprot:XP_013754823.1 hypothetical protein AMSG_09096 [Thecamonas trahens ATCC 50062]